MKKCIILTLVIIMIASSAWSFDGNRKGFVLGGGLGFSPTAKWESDDFSFASETNAGLGAQLFLGYAWNEFNMIVYEGNLTSYTSDMLDMSLYQGFDGATWYHYFNPSGGTMYTIAGLGLYVFEGENNVKNDPGFAVMLGAGYEFSRHWQVGVYFSAGKTSDGPFDFTHNHLNVLVSGVAF